MPAIPFHHVDVFTDRQFEGNPLAVFPDASMLDGAQMQRIAREMNLSETTFVLPPEDSDVAAKVRIFTPSQELRFAGHPTIGTAFVLRQTGAVPHDASSILVEEGIGLVAVRFERQDSFMAWLTTPRITFGRTFADVAGVASALALAASDVHPEAPIGIVSAGTPFFYVPLREPALVDHATLDMRAMRGVIGTEDVAGVYVFALRPHGVYSRMFAPENGIIEDPATGSAAGPLCAYLVRHGLVRLEASLELVIEQGTAMGRRSILHVRVQNNGDAPTIEVGGSAVPLMQGTLRLNAPEHARTE